MTRTVLFYGDSNTYGTPPMVDFTTPNPRFDPQTRWTGVAARALGPDWTVIEEGLPGRTTNLPDPVMGAYMDGTLGLHIALRSHGPIDVLAIMLGTNDTKAMFARDSAAIAGGAAALLQIAFDLELQNRHGGFKVLLVCPPPVTESGCLGPMFFGGPARAQGLPPLYAALARARGAAFFDAGQVIAVSPVDGVHFDAAAHATLGAAMAARVAAL